MTTQNKFLSKSEAGTIQFGRKLGAKLRPGTVVGLSGDLGSGKTTLVKGIALGAGVKDKRQVHSPTFVIFHIYKGRIPLYHFDLYRLEKEAQADDIGLDEFLADPKTISVVEWVERIPSVLKRCHIVIKLSLKSEKERIFQIQTIRNAK